VVAVDPDPAARAGAASDKVADTLLADPGPELAACEVVVLCAPIAAVEGLLGETSRHLADGAILTDICGAKGSLIAAARERVRAGVFFVGAHPMFGGERGGYTQGRADRWQGGTVAVCTDGAPRQAVDRVAALHRSLGAEVVLCTAAEHDAAVAAVSHLPYLLSSALALAAAEAGPIARQLAGRGLADATRLAGFPFEIQGEVARRNPALEPAAARLRSHLDGLLAALRRGDGAREPFDRARAAREGLA
jgi:prephenate dehydrogenase